MLLATYLVRCITVAAEMAYITMVPFDVAKFLVKGALHMVAVGSHVFQALSIAFTGLLD